MHGGIDKVSVCRLDCQIQPVLLCVQRCMFHKDYGDCLRLVYIQKMVR